MTQGSGLRMGGALMTCLSNLRKRRYSVVFSDGRFLVLCIGGAGMF